jgi:beta-fructofuranosidase
MPHHTLRNLDYECYLDAIKNHREYQENWLEVGYAPHGFYLKDFCLIKVGGIYHLFHIAGTPNVSCCLPGNEIWFGHASTKDFQKWQTHQPCLYIDPEGWDNGHVFAPYVVKEDKTYWMFYTGCTLENTQRIGVAISKDLFHWNRMGKRPVIRPEEYDWAFCPTEKGAACRDPHLIKHKDEYWMYYTAVTKEGKACVARATSHNLIEWEDRGPAYVANDLNHCESSNVQVLNGKYLLCFGGHIEYWSYVISDNPAHWPSQEPKPLGKGITGMEVIERNGNRWLVGFFRLGIGHCSKGFRLFLGIIDWADDVPMINQIYAPNQLKEFGF